MFRRWAGALAAAALALAPVACRDGGSPVPEASPAEAPAPQGSRADSPDSQDGPAPGAGNPACDLLTEAELRSAVGAAISSTTPAELGVGGLPGTACIHIFDGPGGQAVMVSRSESPDARRVLDQIRLRAGDRARQVPGIDDALVVGPEAYLRKGPVLVSVTMSLNQDEAATAETGSRLAEAVARRV